MMKEEAEIRVLARNKKARHEYEILDTFEAGMQLAGTEVKSAREGRVQLKDAHVDFRDHVWPKFLRENALRVFGGG